MTAKKAKTKGRKPQLLKLEGDWVKAVKTALGKKRPRHSWPQQSPKTKKRK